MEAAAATRVPAGAALSVDRIKFAELITEKIDRQPNIEIVREEVTEISQDEISIIATGPLTSEALAGAAPEVIVMMNRGAADPESEPDDDSAINGLLSNPALAATPAGRERHVVRMDGLYLLGFGPRTADAVRDLSRALAE